MAYKKQTNVKGLRRAAKLAASERLLTVGDIILKGVTGDFTYGGITYTLADGVITGWPAPAPEMPSYTNVVAEYYMNDNAATTAVVAAVGTNGVATFNTADNTVAGKINTALSYNGTTDWVVAATSTPTGNAVRSLEVWAYFDSPNSSQVVAGLGSGGLGGDPNFFDLLVADDGTLRITAIPGMGEEVIFYNSAISASEWHHIVVTYDGTTLKGYVDGVKTGSGPFSGPLTTASGLAVGATSGTFEAAHLLPFDGNVDVVRVYDVALSYANVVALYNGGTGYEEFPIPLPSHDNVVAEYFLNDNAANTDVIANVGTNGVASFNTADRTVAGKINAAFNFNGSSDYVQMAANANIPVGNAPRSLEVWANADDLSGFEFTLSGQGPFGSTGMFALMFAGNVLWFCYKDTYVATSYTGTPNEWHHYILSYDGTNWFLYVDGVLEDSAALGTTLEGDATTIRIGMATWYNGSYFGGPIDVVRWYNIALTDVHASALYNSGTGYEAFPV